MAWKSRVPAYASIPLKLKRLWDKPMVPPWSWAPSIQITRDAYSQRAIMANAILGRPTYNPHGASNRQQIVLLVSRGEAARLSAGIAGIALKLSDTPGSVRHLGPRLGQHTDEVLSALGYSQDDRERLRVQGIVG